MKIKCPKCRTEYNYREAIKENALVEIMKMQGLFGSHSALIFEYVCLFDSVRPVKALKLLRLLKEVAVIWQSGRFSLQKRTYSISREGMASAIKTVCGKQFETPLQNHRYLMRVMATVAEEETTKRSIEAEKKLKERERRLRSGERPGRPVRSCEDSGERPMSVGDVAKNLPWRKK